MKVSVSDFQTIAGIILDTLNNPKYKRDMSEEYRRGATDFANEMLSVLSVCRVTGNDMTNKEAIEYLLDPIGKDLKVHDEAVRIALDAIEKQIPQKPIGEYRSVLHYICPNCNCTVKLYYDSPIFPYCKHCGQAIDWSEVKNEIENN